MSVTEPQAVAQSQGAPLDETKQAVDPRDAQIDTLKKQLAAARLTLDSLGKGAPKKPNPVSRGIKKTLAGITAAFTTPAAVKAEKSLAAVVIVRFLLYVGAADGTVKLVQAILDAAGVK